MISIADLLVSHTATARGLRNDPASSEITQHLAYTCARCDEVQIILRSYGYSPRLTSGYRSPALSKAVGGNCHDEHTSGLAFDLSVGMAATADNIIPATYVFNSRRLVNGPIHQIIAEPGHVHVGLYAPGKHGACELRVKEGAHYPLKAIAS